MLEFSCIGNTLRDLDQTHGEVIVVGLYRDVRPFRGVFGRIDWRMRGRFSRLAEQGFLRGDLGETLLSLGRPLIPYDTILCIGLGPQASFDDAAFGSALATIARTLTDLSVRRCAIELPGRANERIAPERALDLLLADANGELPFESVKFIEGAEGERRMRERANEERRRTRMR